MTQRCGDTLLFRTPPVIAAQAAVGGKKEGEGPLAAAFDELSSDNRFGQSSWEAAEKYLQLRAARLCLQYHGGNTGSGGCAVRLRGCGAPAGHGVQPFLCRRAAVPHPAELRRCTHPHRPVDRNGGPGVPIAAATFGRVQDYQVRDINNMGAAMAPAAASTLLHYFADTHTEPQEFDCIYTGDLGQVGSSLLRELLAAEGLLVKNHVDCGCILFDAAEQQVKSGGSGPGCCAAVLCGHILPRLLRRSQKRVLFVATGALMSQTTFLQKESIPAVAHLVELRAPEKESGA